jgi:2'-5' RNA ligase
VTNPTSPKLRLFLAVRPGPAALEALEHRLASVRAGAIGERLRWTDPEKLHLTLRFFGSVASEAVGPIGEVCREACAHTPAFDLSLAGAGAFPSPRRASVLWVGVTEGATELRTLAHTLDPKLDALGFTKEEREFTPHLTVARSRLPLQLTAAIAELSSVSISTRIDELLLVRSVLGRPSARYEVIDRHPLVQQ